MERHERIVESKYEPKQTNVVWIDTSKNPPLEKHYIKGKWQTIGCGCNGGGSGWKVEYIYPDIMVYYGFQPRKQDKIYYLVDDLNSQNPNIFYAYVGGDTVYEWHPSPGETIIYDTAHQELWYYEYEGAEPVILDRNPSRDIVENRPVDVVLKNNTIHVATQPDIAMKVIIPDDIDYTFRCQFNFDYVTEPVFGPNNENVWYLGYDYNGVYCVDGDLRAKQLASYSIFYYYDTEMLRGFVQVREIEEPVVTYTVQTTVNPQGGGTVTGAGTYTAGQTCTLVATTNVGYQFSNWTINGSSVSSNVNYSFTVQSDVTVQANFVEQEMYLRFSDNTNTGFTIGTNNPVNGNPIMLEYRYGGGAWTPYTLGDTISVPNKEYIDFRAQSGYTNTFYDEINEEGVHFIISDNVNMSGEMTAIIRQSGTNILQNNALREIFKGCPIISSNANAYITSLGENCFESTFENCNSLTEIGNINMGQANAAKHHCLKMFKDCTKLNKAGIVLPKGYAESCYESMFEGCSMFSDMLVFSSGDLAEACCKNMYKETKLDKGETPDAKNLEDNCFESMFEGCASMKSLWIHGTYSATECCMNIAKDCTILNGVTLDLTEVSSTDCINGWLNNVATSGILNCDSGLNLVAGTDYPIGWTRHNI